jgi:hypothetical protein
MMKDDDGALSKLDLVEAISKCLKENSGCLFSSLRLSHGSNEHLDDGGLLESQQKDLEVKIAQNSMVHASLLCSNYMPACHCQGPLSISIIKRYANLLHDHGKLFLF